MASTHIFVFLKMDPYCIDPYFSNLLKWTHILGPIFFYVFTKFGPIFLIWVKKVQIWHKKLPMHPPGASATFRRPNHGEKVSSVYSNIGRTAKK